MMVTSGRDLNEIQDRLWPSKRVSPGDATASAKALRWGKGSFSAMTNQGY